MILALLQQELNESAHTLSLLQEWEQGADVSDEGFASALTGWTGSHKPCKPAG